MSAPATTRSMDDVAARITTLRDSGVEWLGWRTEVLVDFLDLQRLAELDLLPAIEVDWQLRPVSAAGAMGARWLELAWDEAATHRGVAARRAVENLTEYAWLQGRDDVVAAMDRAGYAQYGVPKLFVYAAAFELSVPASTALDRMGRGEICDPDGCDAGCGR
ncbi:MAG: hypothetical protein ACREN2_05710 [Candidatus Dormibacteria bacterium]